MRIRELKELKAPFFVDTNKKMGVTFVATELVKADVISVLENI